MPPSPSPKKILFGKIAVPKNSPNQLTVNSNSLCGSSPVTLGGSWRALQAKQHSDRLLAAENVATLNTLRTALERTYMTNEDLSSQNARSLRSVEKMRCSDLILENKLDDSIRENDQLRGMHHTAVRSLEETRGKLVGAEAKNVSYLNVIENNSSMKKLLSEDIDNKTSKNEGLELKIQRLGHANKKLQQGLSDSQKLSQMYLQLKDDKDTHIALLVKEKNRLHDQINDMARRYVTLARSKGSMTANNEWPKRATIIIASSLRLLTVRLNVFFSFL